MDNNNSKTNEMGKSYIELLFIRRKFVLFGFKIAVLFMKNYKLAVKMFLKYEIERKKKVNFENIDFL